MQKLVRDRIPEFMELAGVSPEFSILPPADRLRWLLLKLSEESAELTATPNLDECADVYEVVMAIAAELGHSSDDVALAALNKRRERGGFARGIVISISK